MALFVADIGGTHARFALATCGEIPRLTTVVTVPTVGAPHLAGLLALAREAGLEVPPSQARRVVLAVAGAVRQGRAWLPNAGLTVDAADPCLGTGATVINDFVAQAWATLHPEVVGACRVLQRGEAGPGPRLVAGAGTGFGACLLLPAASGMRSLPTEFGHTPYPFRAQEAELARFLESIAGEAIVDAVVSGPGLARLYRWHSGEVLSPAEVAGRLSPGHALTTLFARLYARAVRTLTLTTLPLAGVWVAGGVAAKNPFLVQDPAFVEELHRCQGYEEFLASIPVHLMTHPQAGLLGAAMVAAQWDAQGAWQVF